MQYDPDDWNDYDEDAGLLSVLVFLVALVLAGAVLFA